MRDALAEHLLVRMEDWEVPEIALGTARPPSEPRLGEALPACLAAAAKGQVLDLPRLVDLQRLVLPGAALRTGPAFAKGGRERYGWAPETLPLLDARLRAAHSRNPLLAALTAYLDLQFFHPFDDGNARAGRLAFHFHAARGGLSFRTTAPLFTLPIPAGSERAYRTLLRMAGALALTGGRPLHPPVPAGSGSLEPEAHPPGPASNRCGHPSSTVA